MTGIFRLRHSLTRMRWKSGSIICIPPAPCITAKENQTHITSSWDINYWVEIQCKLKIFTKLFIYTYISKTVFWLNPNLGQLNEAISEPHESVGDSQLLIDHPNTPLRRGKNQLKGVQIMWVRPSVDNSIKHTEITSVPIIQLIISESWNVKQFRNILSKMFKILKQLQTALTVNSIITYKSYTF